METEEPKFVGSIAIGIDAAGNAEIVMDGRVELSALFTASGLLARMANKMIDDYDVQQRRDVLHVARDLTEATKGAN